MINEMTEPDAKNRIEFQMAKVLNFFWVSTEDLKSSLEKKADSGMKIPKRNDEENLYLKNLW